VLSAQSQDLRDQERVVADPLAQDRNLEPPAFCLLDGREGSGAKNVHPKYELDAKPFRMLNQLE
jgi:hypothetical protein